MLINRICRKILLLYVLVCLTGIWEGGVRCNAHPHVFAVGGVDLVINEQRLDEVKVRWMFDELITSAALGFAADQDRAIPVEEGTGFWGEGLPAPYNLKYYVYIEIDGLKQEWTTPEQLQMNVKNGCIWYNFTIPVGMPIGSVVKVWFLDPGNYIAFSMEADWSAVTQRAGAKGEFGINEEQYIRKANVHF